MTKWRNGIRDKSRSTEIKTTVSLKSPSLRICCRIYSVDYSRQVKGSLGFGFQSLSVNWVPRVFLNKLAAFCYDIGRKRSKTICLSHIYHRAAAITFALSSSNHMKWIYTIKPEPTSGWRRSLYTVSGKYVLRTETEWRWMFISNGYKVNFVVQCRYATWQA